MLTIPIVIYGVMRYLQLIYEKMRRIAGESTTYRPAADYYCSYSCPKSIHLHLFDWKIINVCYLKILVYNFNYAEGESTKKA